MKQQITIKNQLTASSFASTLIKHYDPLLMMQISNEGRINSGLQPYYTGSYSSTGAYYPSLQEVESGAWPYFTDWASIVFASSTTNQQHNCHIAKC